MDFQPALKGLKKVLTPEEKYKRQLAIEALLLRRQREYQILAADREIRGGVGKKHRKVINILKKEYVDILTDLDVAASDANAKCDQKIVRQLEELLAQHKNYLCQIKREKAYIRELDLQITLANRSIVELHAHSRTDAQCTAKANDDQHTLEALENKLDTVTKRFCTTMAVNRTLRAEIDHLLIERAGFNKSWEHLCNNLKMGKKFMLDLIEQATLAYDQREEWCQKLAALRSRAFAEFQNHRLSMNDIQRQIDYNGKLQTFLSGKGQRRVMEMLLRKEEERRQEQRRQLEALIEQYSEYIRNIREFCGEEDIDAVARRFACTEHANFSKFNYIVEQNRQMEDDCDELLALQARIDGARLLTAAYDEQQTFKLEKLHARLQETRAAADEAAAQYAQREATLNALLVGIAEVFDLCRCSPAPLEQLLADTASISRWNVLLYLRLIEQRINEMLIAVYYLDVAPGARPPTHIHEPPMTRLIMPITSLVTKDTCPLCVEQTLVSDVIDSLQKVMQRDEICAMLVEAIELRGFNEVVHNVSGCHLPKSRAIIQRRFQ